MKGNINKKGVTLVELITVFVIIAIGAVLLVPNMRPWLLNYRLKSATRDIVSTMRTAQMKAVSTNSPYGVAFDASSIQLYRSSGGLPEGGSIELPPGIQFSDKTFPVNATLNKPYAEFNTNSSCSSGGVTLSYTKGTQKTQKRITTTSSTGRVRVDPP